MNHRFSPAGLSTACLALLIGSALLFAPLAADAADAPGKRSSTAAFRQAAGEVTKARSKQAKAEPAKVRQVEAKAKQSASKVDKAKTDKAKIDKSKTDKSKLARSEPETTGSVGKPEVTEPSCDKSRKRLWVEGEGWVVRRVTTCQLTQN